MEYISFNEILAKLIANPNVHEIRIERSRVHCGCVKPGDIIAVYAYAENRTPNTSDTQGIRFALQHVFDEKPTICQEKIWVDPTTKAIRGYREESKEYYFI